MESSSRLVAEWLATQLKTQVPVKAAECSVRVVGTSSLKIGMILRNDSGAFVAELKKSIMEKVTVLEAEATGMQEALNWIIGLGIVQVVVEGDSLTVINALLRNTTYVSEVGNTIECCRYILRQRNDVKVQHVQRQANKLAHSI